MKKVQSIYQVMQVSPPLNKGVQIGRTGFYFTDHPQRLLKVTGRPVRISDDGIFQAPEMGLATLHPGNYLVIETDCENDTDEAERVAREGNEECAGVVSLLFGKRACEIHIGDNVIQDGKMSLVGDVMRNPGAYKRLAISESDFAKALQFLQKPRSTGARQLELALRWYMKGRREPMGPDAYLSFWVAIEVLFGEWKNVEKKIAEKLALIIPGNFAAALIQERLHIGRLVGVRADIVHNGKQRFETPEESFQLIVVREILEEILKHELGMPSRDRFSTLVADPNEWQKKSKS